MAADPYATIEVRQAGAHNREATVTVAGEDGSQRRAYTIDLRK